MEIVFEGSLIEKAIERSSFNFEKCNEKYELVLGAVLEILEGASSKSAVELCTSAATGFWTIAPSVSKIFLSTFCVASVTVAFIWK